MYSLVFETSVATEVQAVYHYYSCCVLYKGQRLFIFSVAVEAQVIKSNLHDSACAMQ